MNNINFAETVKEIIECTTNIQVNIKEVTKNNRNIIGIERVDEDGINPTFYVENFETPEQMVNFIINYQQEKPDLGDIKEIMMNKDEIMKRVKVKIVNKEKNQNNRIGKDLGNGLKAEFYVEVLDNTGSVTITEEIKEKNNLDIEELYKKGLENIEDDVRIRTFSEMIFGFASDDFPAYVITNKKNLNGASAILTKGMKEKIENKIGHFYVLPSSVHEVIVVTVDEAEYYRNVVRSVNETVLKEEEFLSNDIFRLPEDGILTIV